MATLPIDRPVTPLRQRMLDDMAMRSMRARTQHDYVRHVRAFSAFLGRSPDTATAEDVRRFQLHQRKHDAGAIGLMQVTPATWATMRVSYRLGTNPDDPHDNVIAGTAFLRLMYDRFGYPGLFAAYNAGPSRYAAYLAGRSRLPAETAAYLGGVTGGRSAAAVTIARVCASAPPSW